jgi:hypothetical protein
MDVGRLMKLFVFISLFSNVIGFSYMSVLAVGKRIN